MNKYESVIIINPEFDEATLKALEEKFTGLINENGKVEEVIDLGKRKLAYEIKKNKEAYYVQFNFESKPEAIAEKMVQGRIGKFYGEICLVEQVFVKNSDMKVKDLLQSKGAKVIRFARFEKGEGIEKKEENFAEEVMKQIK